MNILGERSGQEHRSLEFDKCWKYYTIYNGIKIVGISNSKIGKYVSHVPSFVRTQCTAATSVQVGWGRGQGQGRSVDARDPPRLP